MKNTQIKSFTFKVAQQTQDKKTQFKAREGVAIAGCTMTQTPWGREPTYSFQTGGDGGFWC
jgi:hypothetical protein